MKPVEVPDNAKNAFPSHRVVSMGPPQGVSDDDCGTAEMLLGDKPVMAGFGGRDQRAFFKPSDVELDILNAGGLIVMNQIGTLVQPFSVGVWAQPKEQTDATDD